MKQLIILLLIQLFFFTGLTQLRDSTGEDRGDDTSPTNIKMNNGRVRMKSNKSKVMQSAKVDDKGIINQADGYNIKNNKIEKHEADNSLFKDKPWEIKPNLAARGATGRLFINIPKDAECVITISQPVSERQVVYSISDRSFSLVPGTYDVTVSGKKTKEVIVQKGMDTRIKGGALNVVATGTWTLYDEKKDRQVYYSNNPKKIGLPVGTYHLEINGTQQEIKIKDGEMVEF